MNNLANARAHTPSLKLGLDEYDIISIEDLIEYYSGECTFDQITEDQIERGEKCKMLLMAIAKPVKKPSDVIDQLQYYNELVCNISYMHEKLKIKICKMYEHCAVLTKQLVEMSKAPAERDMVATNAQLLKDNENMAAELRAFKNAAKKSAKRVAQKNKKQSAAPPPYVPC